MIERLPFTTVLLAMLRTATGKPVGHGQIPTNDAHTQVIPPYYLLYTLDGSAHGAPLADENEDATFVYQLTCVSGPDPAKNLSRGSPGQAEWLADKARTAILGRDPDTGLWLHPLTVAGASVMCREVDTEPGATNDPGDAIISYVLRPKFVLTPA